MGYIELIVMGLVGIVMIGGWIGQKYQEMIKEQRERDQRARGLADGDRSDRGGSSARNSRDQARSQPSRGGGKTGAGEPLNLSMSERIERARAKSQYEQRQQELRGGGASAEQQQERAARALKQQEQQRESSRYEQELARRQQQAETHRQQRDARREKQAEQARQRQQHESRSQASAQSSQGGGQTRQPNQTQPQPSSRPQTQSRSQPRPQQQPQRSRQQLNQQRKQSTSPNQIAVGESPIDQTQVGSGKSRIEQSPRQQRLRHLQSKVGADAVVVPKLTAGAGKKVMLSAASLRQGMVLKELLDRPVAMRDYQEGPFT